MTLDHRHSGGDEGLTFDLTVAGAKDEGKESCASIAFTRPSLSCSAPPAKTRFTI